MGEMTYTQVALGVCAEVNWTRRCGSAGHL